MTFTKRTHFIGEFTDDTVGSQITVNGWVARQRDKGGIVFVDVRDRSGRLQTILEQGITEPELIDKAKKVRPEFVVAITGTLRQRENLAADKPDERYELAVSALEIISQSPTPPFDIESDEAVSEDLRLAHRVLDLRRDPMQQALRRRHEAVQVIRQVLSERGFIDIETPILNKSTPEGARDFLVPSRLNPGEFYALPQSPQIFKQMLMVSGFERYFQVCRCFRDEDARGDRQLEFTQLDLEMSFVDEDDVLAILESVAAAVSEQVYGESLSLPLPRMTYAEAMSRYGSDKPDLRFDLPLQDVSDIASRTEFKVFTGALAKNGRVLALHVPGGSSLSRKDLDALTEVAKQHGAGGLAWVKWDGATATGPASKFLIGDVLQSLQDAVKADHGDLTLFAADSQPKVYKIGGAVRLAIGKTFNLIDVSKRAWLWVTEFPLFERDDETQALHAMHHPFTSPFVEDLQKLESDPTDVRSRAYDLVLNGTELGSGSIRIHDAELQDRMFQALKLDSETIASRFGFLLDALKYGAPPHGGFAMGLDRLLMILENRETIRDVIAFPKTSTGACLLSKAPSTVDPDQLRELGLSLTESKETPSA